MMRAIVHCGPPKTGTTALQQALVGVREELAKSGILYPKFDRDGTHKWLSPSFLPYERLPNVLRNRYGTKRDPESVVERSRDSWVALESSTRKFEGDQLVLSSGAFFHIVNREEASAFGQLLARVAQEFVFCIYLREPVDLYYSQLRHNATAYGTIKRFKPLSIKPFESAINNVFGGDLTVRSLSGVDDISVDFLRNVVHVQQPIDGLVRVRANSSLSNEAIQFLLDYRERVLPRSIGRRDWRIENLRDLLHEIDLVVPGRTSGGLTEEARQLVRARSTEMRYWREKFGIDFEAHSGNLPSNDRFTSLDTTPKFADLCEIDQGRYEEIYDRVAKAQLRLALRRPHYFFRMRRRLKA